MSRKRDINESVRETVKSLRKSKKLSQLELAQKMGIAQSTLSRIESGTSHISPDLIQQFANYFNVPTSVIIGEKALPQDVMYLRQFSSDLSNLSEGCQKHQRNIEESNKMLTELCALIGIQSKTIEKQNKTIINQAETIESSQREIQMQKEMLDEIVITTRELIDENKATRQLISRLLSYIEAIESKNKIAKL